MLPDLKNEKRNYKTIDLLSSKKIGITKWRVEEEKELLFALEGLDNNKDSNKEITKFMKKCVDDEKKFDTLSKTDLVYLLCQLRIISKGSTIEYNYKCSGNIKRKKDKEEILEPCNFPFEGAIVSLIDNLVTRKFNAEPIKISDELIFNIKEISHIDRDLMEEKYKKITEYNFNTVLKSIDSIIYKNEVYENFSEEELNNFITGMDSNDFETLGNKIDDAQAEIKLEQVLKCGKCKSETNVDFGNLIDFFLF